MKKSETLIKILYSIITLLILSTIFSNIVFASAVDPVAPKTPNNATVKNTMTTLIGIFQVIAVGVAVIMITVLAIKYMSASPNDRAEVKKHAAVYVVGAVMAFGATGVVEIIKQFAIDALK